MRLESDSQTEAGIALEVIHKEDFGQQFDVRRHRLECEFMRVMFTASPITWSSETCITLQTML